VGGATRHGRRGKLAGGPDYGRIVPRLQAFFGGDPEAWFHQPAWVIRTYMRMLPALQAERQLAAIEAASAPNMTKQSYKDTVSGYMRTIDAGAAPTRATAAALAGIGIAVEYVTAEEVTL
jgi:hypothetical protein